MFGIGKKQKIDSKALLSALDTALDNWMDASGSDALLAETGKTRQQMLDAVLADDEVESCREDLRTAILAEPWRIWGEDVPEEIINRLYRIIRRHANTFVELALLARFGGYAVAEYVYKREADGFLTLDKVLSKDGELDRYQPKRDGSLTMRDLSGDEITINQSVKYLLLTSRAVPARPAGELMIIRAYPAVCLRKRGWAYAGQFIKRYAQPYVVGKQGGYSSIHNFTSTLFGFINGGAVGVGTDDDITMHQLNGDGEAFEKLERLANRRIQKLLLGRVKTSELTAGSRAAQETEEETRQDRISAYLDLLANAIQHALDAMMLVNQSYGTPIHAPQGLWFEYQQQFGVDVARAQRDEIYMRHGLQLTTEYLTNIVGYEKAHIAHFASPTALAESDETFALSLKPSDNNLSKQDEHEQALMQPKIEAVLSLLDECDDYTTFEAKLADLKLPDNGLLNDLVQRCTASYTNGLSGKKPDWA